jgi:predicted helicase
MNNYIYIRINEYWDTYNACKLGKTSSIPDRETNYITSEINHGIFMKVIELQNNNMDIIEIKLQEYFNKLGYHIKFNAGIEFYNKKIIELIIPYLIQNNIIHKELNNDEIKNLIKKNRLYEKPEYNSDIIKPYEKSEYTYDIIKPYEEQQIIVNIAYEYLIKNERGILIIPCGVGKTLISLWISSRLNISTILIGVPNKLLLKQWSIEIRKVFPNINYFLVKGRTTLEEINNFLKNNNTKCIMITTYSSSS